MLTLNVNGTVYNNKDSCKLYNLSAQELHALDIYIMTGNIDAQEWLLTRNSDNSPRITFELDRFGSTQGQLFDIARGVPGESFSNPIVYARIDRGIDDNAHIQLLPSHNAIAQKPIRMIGGTNSSEVGTEWGKVRATPPKGTVDEAAFYNERSEWYINLATRDDFLNFRVRVSGSTNLADLDSHMKEVIIVIQPSQHQRLKKNYMYYDTDNEPPRIETTGVIY